MSARDDESVRILDPGSWFRGIRTQKGRWQDRRFVHVGTRLVELEFMRYAPRRPLTRLLDSADLVQVVAGTPCWALAAARTSKPLFLKVATLTGSERAPRQRLETGAKAIWRRFMTTMTKRLDRVGLRKADRVFVLNRKLERRVSDVISPGRVTYAPPGVDTDRFRPDGSGGESGCDAYVLSVARFDDPRKNAEMLIRAYGKLVRRESSSVPELWLAGVSGPRGSVWQVARELAVADRIRYLGEVSDDKLASLYRNAAFFVLASDEEGFGLVLIEAMASGIPVVSTACGGPEDVITDGREGYLVPTGDAGGLAEAMSRLVGDSALREKMGQRGRQTAVKRYSLSVAGDRFLDTYDSVLDSVTGKAAGDRTSSGPDQTTGRNP